MKKPSNVDEFLVWYKNEFDVSLSDYKKYYEATSLQLLEQIDNGNMINRLNYRLQEYQDEYYIKSSGFNLYYSKVDFILQIKPFESIIDKIFRKNILLNKNYPKAPNAGWINHDNLFTRINDIFRGMIVVKYLDGVKFFVEKLEMFSSEESLSFESHFEAREEGYYAAHCYMIFELDVLQIDWDSTKCNVKIELQITTQLQEVIRKLLHQFYEKDRIKSIKKNSEPWQWEYEKDKFSANYLGHILHYMEGMILEVRDKNFQKERKNGY